MVKEAKLDPVIQHGLSSRIKYVRLVSKDVHGRARYYAQLFPHVKVDKNGKRMHPIGNQTVGFDIGPATIANVGDSKAELDLFTEAVIRDHRWIRKLQRKKNHKRRANNPEYYDEKGYTIKGKHPMKKSRHQREIEMVISELHRKTLHGQLANQVMAMGTHINTEKLSYKALQKRFGRSTSLRAPKLFLSILIRRGKRAGRQVEEFRT